MAITGKLNGKAGAFHAEDFTPTIWATAEEKAKFANKLTRFILEGFQQGSFTKRMYQRLSSMFGHIAHYDINGFYNTWFTDVKSCREWVGHVTSSWLSGIGDPKFTWSDVEKALIQWIKDNQLAEQLDELHQMDIERNERTMLNALQQKYPSPRISVSAEEATHVSAQVLVTRNRGHQLSLFQEDGCCK